MTDPREADVECDMIGKYVYNFLTSRKKEDWKDFPDGESESGGAGQRGDPSRPGRTADLHPRNGVTTMVKFLRRSTPEGGPASDEQALDLVKGLAAAEGPAPDVAAVSRAVLRKLDILQARDKKMKLIRSISRLDSAWACSVLFELLSDSSEEIRDLAVRELASRDDCPLDGLYDRLRQPPWYVKSAILRIFCLRRDAGAVSAIGAVIDDPNVEVRRWASLALGRIGGPDARALLVRLAKDRNGYVKQAATDALDKICDFKFS
jgi:hypothetical protein